MAGEGIESYVQLAPDSTGKKVWTLEVQQRGLTAAGGDSPNTVEMEVVTVRDDEGNQLELESISLLPLILAELREIRKLLADVAERET